MVSIPTYISVSQMSHLSHLLISKAVSLSHLPPRVFGDFLDTSVIAPSLE